ncbi:MAG: S9 family peptidase [Deltaproteobacteria bacterium]|nr:S9 family peptidase [Deltaproteobacteria bacterium]
MTRAAMGVVLGLLVGGGAAGPAAAEPGEVRRAMTAEDLWNLVRVSDPRVSPDGSQVVFVATRYDLEANKGNDDLYVVPAAGGEVRRLTTSEGPDRSPRWLPNGSAILFLSVRSEEETPQIFRMPMGGGDPVAVTDYPSGVSSFFVSPDGATLAVTTDVFPDCEDLDCTRERAKEREESGVTAVVADALPYRVWNAVRGGMVSHLFVQPLDGAEPPRDLTPGGHDCPPIDLGTPHDVAFSPDGAFLAYVLNADEGIAWSTNNDVWEVPLASGGVVRQVSTGGGNDAGPAYSPDGKWLAWLSMERPGFEADRRRVMLQDRATGEVRELGAALDRSPESLAWTPDSAALLFVAADRGRERVFRVDVSDGVARAIVEDASYGSLDLSPDGSWAAAVRQSHAHPPEVVRVPLDGGAFTVLDKLNDELLGQLAMPTAREFWFEGANGDRVQGFLLEPADLRRGRKIPAVFALHGGPQGAFEEGFHFRWNLQLLTSPGYAVVAVNFHGSVGYGQAFEDAVSGDWGGAPYEDVMKAVDYVVAEYPEIDGERLAAVGASYGGYLVDWILGHTDRFRCLVTHAGVSELWSKYGSTDEQWFPEWEFGGTPWENPESYDRWSPLRYAADFRTPTLVSHGEGDFRVVYTQGTAIFTALQRQGVPSRLLLFPDEDHFVRKPKNAMLFWRTMFDWFATYLEPERPVWVPPSRAPAAASP